MLVHRRITPNIKLAATYLYTWVEWGTVKVKCLAQEHNTMSPARARTRTARSGVERTNHEAIAPPYPGRKVSVTGCHVTIHIFREERTWKRGWWRGARFSNAPIRFRILKAALKSPTLWLQSYFLAVILNTSRVSFVQEVSRVYTSIFKYLLTEKDPKVRSQDSSHVNLGFDVITLLWYLTPWSNLPLETFIF